MMRIISKHYNKIFVFIENVVNGIFIVALIIDLGFNSIVKDKIDAVIAELSKKKRIQGHNDKDPVVWNTKTNQFNEVALLKTVALRWVKNSEMANTFLIQRIMNHTNAHYGFVFNVNRLKPN